MDASEQAEPADEGRLERMVGRPAPERADVGTDCPVACLHVGAEGELAATFYTPGLPEGSYDVWTMPVDTDAEIKRLRDELTACNERIELATGLCREAQMLATRYGWALNKIAERTGSDDPCRHLVRIARDALLPPNAEVSGHNWPAQLTRNA